MKSFEFPQILSEGPIVENETRVSWDRSLILFEAYVCADMHVCLMVQ